MKKKLIKGLLYILGIITLAYIVIKTDWKQFSIHIGSLSLKDIVLLFLGQCITVLLLTLQWKSMALRLKKDVSFLDIVMMNAKGSVVDAITPGVKAGGELARVYELKKRLQIDFGEATIVVALQKTLSLLSFLFLTLFSLIWFSFSMSINYRHYLYGFAALIAVFSVFLALLVLFSLKPGIMIKGLNRLLGKTGFLPKASKILGEYSSIIRSLLREKRKFFLQMMLAIFIWFFYAFKLFLVMRAFSLEMDFISIAAITFLSYIAGMIPILPGSIGSFESSMVILLAIKGVSMEMGLTVAFVFRFVTFWFEFVISGLLLMSEYLFTLVSSRKGEGNVKVRA